LAHDIKRHNLFILAAPKIDSYTMVKKKSTDYYR